MIDPSLREFIQTLPKTELHLHIEGSFEPDLMFDIAQRNGISIPFKSADEVKAAYNFSNLQEFLDIYYAGANVLIEEQDFFDLTWAYLTKVADENVQHVEIFFDPQTHTDRGVPFKKVIDGIYKALEKGKSELRISYKLILSFLRHLDEESAFKTLEEAMPYKDRIEAVGLDSSEVGNPPSKFNRVFAESRKRGFKCVAHAGEEGPAEYIWEALDLLKVVRIDHGNRCLDDLKLIERLVNEQIPLTICPLSNMELKVVEDLKDHPLKVLMDKGLLATIHSDDPAYFGGYMNANFIAVANALDLNAENMAQLAVNGFKASWLPEKEKQEYIDEINTLLYHHLNRYNLEH